MDSEKIATNHVELAISKTGHLVSHINSNDKEPSWDGDVEVYKKSGHVHAKADLILKVPVQVKGHIKPNLKKKSIKYSIQYTDEFQYSAILAYKIQFYFIRNTIRAYQRCRVYGCCPFCPSL